MALYMKVNSLITTLEDIKIMNEMMEESSKGNGRTIKCMLNSKWENEYLFSFIYIYIQYFKLAW